MALQGSDVVMTVLVLIVILGLASPIYYFIGEVSASTGVLTRSLLSISVPALLLMLINSVATAARSDR